MNDYVIRGFKYRLHPTEHDRIMFSQTFGCVRKVWNILRSEAKEGIYRKISEIKDEYDYMRLVDSQALTSSWKDYNQTMKHANNGVCGYPRNKSKYNPVQSYTTYADSSNLRIKGSKIYLRKVGWVKVNFHRELPTNYKIKAATIKREAGEYYISLRIEYELVTTHQSDCDWVIGLDYSPSKLYVDQNGQSPEHIKQFLKEMKQEEQKVKRLSKVLSRKEQGSNNWTKIKYKLQKQHKHIANKRKDFYHKESRKIVNNYTVVSIENLDLKSMGVKPKYNPAEPIDFQEASKAKRRRKAMFQAGYRIFTDMLKYKLEDEEKTLLQVNRFFPSTKMCSKCGHVQDMPTEIRVFECEVCEQEMDRDQNAAWNLVHEWFQVTMKEELKQHNIKMDFLN